MTATTAQHRRPILAELRPEQVVAVIDTREQLPLNLSPLQTVAGTLTTGDYSVKGLEGMVAIERKSLGDLLGCIGQHRERFDREVQRLLAYPVRAIVIEATWPDIEQGEWQSKVTPSAAIGSVLGWIASGVPVIMAGDHARAGRYVSRLLFTAARRRWREALLPSEAVALGEAIEAVQRPKAEKARVEGVKAGGKKAGKGRPLSSRKSLPRAIQDESARRRPLAVVPNVPTATCDRPCPARGENDFRLLPRLFHPATIPARGQRSLLPPVRPAILGGT